MQHINPNIERDTSRITASVTGTQREIVERVSKGRGLSEAGAIRAGIMLLGMADAGVLYTRSEAGEYEPVTIFVKNEEAF